MACSIGITSITGTTSNNWSPDSLTITGTVTDCPQLSVKVNCGPAQLPTALVKQTTGVPSGTGTWSVTFSAADMAGWVCACGEVAYIEATCASDPSCSVWAVKAVDCCPTVSFDFQEGVCRSDGTKPVTVSATITPGPNSQVAVQAELLLDGNVVDTGTASSAAAPLTLSYYAANLASGIHPACVNFIQPSCDQQCQNLQFNCTTDPDGNSADCKTTYRRWLCPLVWTLMCVSFTTALALAILTNLCLGPLATLMGPPFVAIVAALNGIAAVAIVTGFIAWAVFLLHCKDCVCGWGAKLIWRICFAAGAVVTACAGLCGNLLWIGIMLMIVGIAALLVWAKTCNKSVCAVVKEAIFVIGVLLLPVLVLVLSFPAAASWVLILFTFGSALFTFVDALLIVFFLLVIYDQTHC